MLRSIFEECNRVRGSVALRDVNLTIGTGVRERYQLMAAEIHASSARDCYRWRNPLVDKWATIRLEIFDLRKLLGIVSNI